MHKYIRNKEFGFFEAVPKPSIDDLHEYYKTKYYQNELGSYTAEYTADELKYFENRVELKNYIVNKENDIKPKSMVDIGCGEGHVLNYYDQKGYDVVGLDFSDFGLVSNHPHLRSKLIQGDVFDGCRRLIEEGKTYDIIWLDNVLEHVIDPGELLELCYQLANTHGTLVIEVPNDFSDLQLELINTKKISKRYWESYPDHLNYFSPSSLEKFCNAKKWSKKKIIADFPIEWLLTNENSNYVESDVGIHAHLSRLFIENFMYENNQANIDDLVNFYEALAKINQGRVLVSFFTKNI